VAVAVTVSVVSWAITAAAAAKRRVTENLMLMDLIAKTLGCLVSLGGLNE
jgi:hypothetical protein